MHTHTYTHTYTQTRDKKLDLEDSTFFFLHEMVDYEIDLHSNVHIMINTVDILH